MSNTAVENMNQAKSDLLGVKAGLITQGVEIPEGTPTREYRALVESISGNDKYEFTVTYENPGQYIYDENIGGEILDAIAQEKEIVVLYNDLSLEFNQYLRATLSWKKEENGGESGTIHNLMFSALATSDWMGCNSVELNVNVYVNENTGRISGVSAGFFNVPREERVRDLATDVTNLFEFSMNAQWDGTIGDFSYGFSSDGYSIIQAIDMGRKVICHITDDSVDGLRDTPVCLQLKKEVSGQYVTGFIGISAEFTDSNLENLQESSTRLVISIDRESGDIEVVHYSREPLTTS